jgi:hypothetical protein
MSPQTYFVMRRRRWLERFPRHGPAMTFVRAVLPELFIQRPVIGGFDILYQDDLKPPHLNRYECSSTS